MEPDIWSLYRLMLKSRMFEEAVIQIWNEGKISGEMHLGIGEEAIAAGICAQLKEGDAMALDHRGTPPLIMRGVEPAMLLREFLGHPDGLCAGMGGHMHLFCREHLIASSGIVGASGPAAVGFALAAQHLRPATLSVAFFGEGAMNQGMLMESLNLAVIWNLPVLFVCKDDEWAITTLSHSVTGGNLVARASGFGMHGLEVDGSNVTEVWHAAHGAIERARRGDGPTFLHAQCVHPEGHFLGDPLLRIARHPIRQAKDVTRPLLKSSTKLKGGSLRARTGSLGTLTSLIGKAKKDRVFKQRDPLNLICQALKQDKERLEALEGEVRRELQNALDAALISSGNQ